MTGHVRIELVRGCKKLEVTTRYLFRPIFLLSRIPYETHHWQTKGVGQELTWKSQIMGRRSYCEGRDTTENVSRSLWVQDEQVALILGFYL